MSERNFSRRRNKGPMRFRPTGGLGAPKATQARTEATSNKTANEEVFDTGRHTREIEESENLAAGLPAETPPPEVQEEAQSYKRDYREPNLETPAEVKAEEEFSPVHVPDRPEGIVESIRVAANKVLKKVQRLIKPVKRIYK